MKINPLNPAVGVFLAVCFAAGTDAPLQADTFGIGPNEFTIGFVTIGNPGNLNDAGAGGGIYSSPYGGVGYSYRMGIYEIPQDAINKATASGMTNVTAGAFSGNKPAGNMTWYECAAFVNWLNTSTGHQAAYDLTWTGSTWTMNLWSTGQAWQADGQNLFRHKDAYYFLPSEDEWYKAAFHKNDGLTANYWDYSTGSNSIPDGIDFDGDTAFDVVFRQDFVQAEPNEVTNVGVASPYGTVGQTGNIQEWQESAFDGLNNSASENRAAGIGGWSSGEDGIRSSGVGLGAPTAQVPDLGFRVASVVPEPSSAALIIGSGMMFLARRRRASSL
jgi:hypothetical protein